MGKMGMKGYGKAAIKKPSNTKKTGIIAGPGTQAPIKGMK